MSQESLSAEELQKQFGADAIRRARELEQQRSAQVRALLNDRTTPLQQQQLVAQMRPSQSEGTAALQQQFGSFRTRLSPAVYHGVSVTENDNVSSVGNVDERSPHYGTAMPEYFHNYKDGNREDQLAMLHQIVSDRSSHSAMLHYGLTLALFHGDMSSTHELLLRGAPISERTPDNVLSAPRDKQIPLLDALAAQGWRPLHRLFKRFMQAGPNVELLEWFLSHGIDPNYGIKRYTPGKPGGPSYECADALETVAYYGGSAEVIEVLIAAGAKVAYGRPLHAAAGATPPDYDRSNRKGFTQNSEFDASRIPVMAALVAHGADVNQMEESANLTPGLPLVYAVSVGAMQRARWLLDHGADPQKKGPYGCAANFANIMGSEEMKELFRPLPDAQSG